MKSRLLAEVLDEASEDSEALFSGAAEILRLESDSQVLQGLLERVQTIVPSRDTKPVLKNIQLSLTEKALQIYATNLDFSLVVTSSEVVPRLIGTAIVPAKRFLEVIKEASGDVELSVFPDTARVTAGRTVWELKLQSGYKYPSLPNVSGLKKVHEVDREGFLQGLQSVKYAVGRDASRSAASLMMVNISNGKMTACDGGRFQQVDLEEGFPVSLNIPVDALDELIKVLRLSGADTFRIGETDRLLVFQTASSVFTINKLSAKFPDMEKVLLRPSLTNNRELRVSRKTLLSAIKRVRVNADPDTSAVGLTLTVNRLILSAQDRTGNEAQEVLDVEWLGDETYLVVNHYYLTELIQMSSSEVCNFRLGYDTQTRKAPILLQDERSVGVIPQMNSDWVGVLQR